MFRFLFNLFMFQLYVLEAAWNLKVYPIIAVPFIVNKRYRAAYLPYLVITVNYRKLPKLTLRQVEMAANHEMRHHWQTLNYPDVCRWWRAHLDLYMRFYKTPLNWMEEDARRYSRPGRASVQFDPPMSAEQLEAWSQEVYLLQSKTPRARR